MDGSILRLSSEQQDLFNQVVDIVLPGLFTYDLGSAPGIILTKTQRLVFLYSTGGPGMTFIRTAVQLFLNSRVKPVLMVASAVIVVQLLDRGGTAHCSPRILIRVHEESTYTIDASSQLAEQLRRIHVITWNESLMSHRHNAEAVDRSINAFMHSKLPFGGILVFIGYFRRILQAVRPASLSQIINVFSKLMKFPTFQNLTDLRRHVSTSSLWRPKPEPCSALGFCISFRSRRRKCTDELKRSCTSFSSICTKTIGTTSG